MGTDGGFPGIRPDALRHHFNFSVIKPLNQSVRSLQECIDHLRRQLSETEAKRQEMAERLSRVEEATDHVQHRLDVIEQRQNE